MTEQDAIKNINTYIYSELESIPKQLLESLKLACFTIKEVEQYREIGTPEECRAAAEKQKAKKMIIKNDNGRPRRACGGCGCFVLPASRFCSKCGQKLDWSDEE